MDQYIGSQKLATYLHPGPTGPFLEFNNEPLRPPSPSTSALLQHNPSLIDLCTFNSLCQRLVENSSTNPTSPYKPILTPSELFFTISPLNEPDFQQTVSKSDLPTSPAVSSAGDCSPNVSSCASTPYSSPQIKQLFAQNSPLDLSSAMPPKETIIIDTKLLQTNHSSPILHRLLASPTNKSSQIDTSENENVKSPQYRPRFSPYYNHEAKTSTKIISKNSQSSRSSCRSPVFNRRSPHDQTIFDTDHDSQLTNSNSSMTLLPLDIDEKLSKPDNNSTLISTPKRSLETTEQVFVKRRVHQSTPTILTQRNYCISYPKQISQCIDCQTANPKDFSLYLAGCRFQHCRIFRYFGDNVYEVEGFTTSTKATKDDTTALVLPDSGGQPVLNTADANYIFSRIAKVFCLIFQHEQTERSTFDESTIIWRKSMAGWREVCDECLTTLFNSHYMCTQCGHMICIECSYQLTQLTIEKRKKLKRFCPHETPYSLAEFIPWEILVKLRSNVIDYLSKLQIDYSIKLYPSTKAENLSMFIKTLKTKRLMDSRDVQRLWSADDCEHDSNIEFFCNGRLPVFNEWNTESTKNFFRKVWSTSCPVLVRRVHENLSKTLWQPEAFKEHMIDHRETPALWDCETLTPILTNADILTKFWDGFEKLNVRLRDENHNRRPRILKLKDWPTKKDFASVFPTLLHDLMTNIPFGDYTRRSYQYQDVVYYGGTMNIVERLPACLVKPDLGPKLYIAYSQLTSQATRKAGTTNLHIDVSDAVNVLVYVGIGGHGDDGSDKEEEIQQVEAEILDSNIDEAQLQRLRNGERPGALWHLFRSDDAKKIREYIGRTRRKCPGSDTIHDQTAYLEKEDLEKLREWSQVECYPILQFLGDAVFIPSGAPHQVKNLHSCIKIAEDFVSPENLDRCLITTNEFRTLSKTHTNHADILQAKNILYYATRDSLHSLTDSINESSLENCT